VPRSRSPAPTPVREETLKSRAAPSSPRACCWTATGWCSGASVRGSVGCRRGASWSRSTAAARRAASCAAGASSPWPRGAVRAPRGGRAPARGAPPRQVPGADIVVRCRSAQSRRHRHPRGDGARGSGHVLYLDGVAIRAAGQISARLDRAAVWGSPQGVAAARRGGHPPGWWPPTGPPPRSAGRGRRSGDGCHYA
jgi:hypothetical protein